MNTLAATPMPNGRGPAIAEPTVFAPAKATLAAQITLCVFDEMEAVRGHWKSLEARGISSVYQRYEWVETSLRTIDRHCQPFIVVGFRNEKPAFILPLAISGRFVRMLRWVGGGHSNFNMGLYSREFLNNAEPADLVNLVDRLKGLAPGASLLKLCCQPAEWKDRRNPMLALPHQRSMNPAFMMDMRDGFETLLARNNGKRKRKKLRNQKRQAEQAGGYRLIVAATPCETERLAEVFFRQKARRLRKLGIANAFASHSTQIFVKEMARRSLDMDEPVLRLFGLEVGGDIVAVFGGGIHGRHLSGYFTSIDDRATAPSSPGEMLLHLLAADCAKNGLAFIDLGNGDERYKRSWCDQRIQMVDVILPLDLAGRPVAGAIRLVYHAKRMIRESAIAWSLVGHLRAARGRLATLRDA